MIIFTSDLDNTLIYSYKHAIGSAKQCVEIYQGREISFMTNKSLELLYEIAKRIRFVPTTTRTVEQYERIFFGDYIPKYALVCNGGVLLENGERNVKWYQESLRQVEDCRNLLEDAIHILECDVNRNFEIRLIDDLFLFTKSEKPECSIARLKQGLNDERMEIFYNSTKVYVLPKVLNKGNAMNRLKKLWGADYTIAAGDSEFDISMLKEADLAYMPKSLGNIHPNIGEHCVACTEDGIFSEQMLEAILLKLA